MIQRFAKNVLALLRVENKSVSEFEKKLGISVGYLSRKANKGGAFDLQLAADISKIVGYSVDTLITDNLVKSCEKQIIENQIKELQSKLENLGEV